jgi:4-amino-4-deoxy-L-arabinose transferase-like glycosyltransferase
MKLYLQTPFLLAALAVLTFAAYCSVLGASFNSLDDQFSIVENQKLRNVGSIGSIFQSSFFADASYYRPLVYLTYLVEYQLFKLNPFFYYLDNIFLHVLTAFSVYFLARRLTRNQIVSACAALLFAIHPVNAEPVANIAGRSVLLSTFFILNSFLFFLKSREQRYFIIVSLLMFAGALLSKESAVVFPGVLFLYLLSEKKRGKDLILPVLPFTAVLFIYMMFRQTLGITDIYHWEHARDLFLGFSSFLRGVLTYLRLFIFPVGLYFDRSQTLFLELNAEIILTWIAFLSLVGCLWINRRQLSGLFVFCLLWFALELFPVSQIVSAIGVSPGYISLAEHFLYTASVGMFLAMTLGGQFMYEVLRKRNVSKNVLILIFTGMIVFYFLTTVEQAVYAKNKMAMLKRSVLYNPENSRVLYTLGLECAKKGLFEEAEQYFRRATHIDPARARYRIALGKSLCDQGKFEACMTVYNSISDAGKDTDLLNKNKKFTRNILEKIMKEHHE